MHYDSRGNKISSISYVDQYKTLVATTKSEFQYDKNDNQLSSSYFNWDSKTNSWKGNSKSEYSYDSNGNQVEEKSYSWDTGSGNWINKSKTEISYDDHGNITVWEIYSWDKEEGDWVYPYKEEFTYQDDNLILRAAYLWEPELEDWVGDSKEEYIYDEFGNKTFYANYFWDNDINDWAVINKETYYYSEDIVLTEQQPVWLSKVLVYPNPASEYVYISESSASSVSFVLYDLSGKQVLGNESRINEKTYSLNIIKPGVYIYNLMLDGKIESGKIIVK